MNETPLYWSLASVVKNLSKNAFHLEQQQLWLKELGDTSGPGSWTGKPQIEM